MSLPTSDLGLPRGFDRAVTADVRSLGQENEKDENHPVCTASAGAAADAAASAQQHMPNYSIRGSQSGGDINTSDQQFCNVYE